MTAVRFSCVSGGRRGVQRKEDPLSSRPAGVPPRDVNASATSRRQFLMRSLGAAASVSSLAILDGCGSSSAPTRTVAPSAAVGTPPKVPTGRLRAAMWDAPGNFVPVNIISNMDFTVLANAADGLLTWNHDYTRLVPALATSYEVSSDARKWTFHLRPNVTFHDGTPFNSAAVKQNYEFFLKQKASGASFGFLVPEISSIDDSDSMTAIITLREPFYGFAEDQALLQMLSPKSIARGPKYLAQHVVGTGAYRLVSSSPQSVVLAPNEHYWGNGPYLSQLELIPLNDEASQVTALQADNMDLITQVLPRPFSQLTQGSSFSGAQVTSWGIVLMIFRCDLPPMNDVRVRQAIAYALDREALSKDVMGGTWPVWNTMSPAGLPGTITPDVVYDYDPERARSLLAAAGYKKGFETWLGTGTTDPNGLLMVEAMAEMLAKVGLNIHAELLDGTVLSEQEAARHSKYTFWYDQNTDLSGTGGLLYELGYFSQNDAHYTGKQILSLQQQLGLTQAGSPASLKVLRALQNAYAEQVPVLPLFAAQAAAVWRRGVQNYYPPKTAIIPDFTSVYWAS